MPWTIWIQLAKFFGIQTLNDTIPHSVWEESGQSLAMVHIGHIDGNGKICGLKEIIVNKHQALFLILWQTQSIFGNIMSGGKTARLLWKNLDDGDSKLQVITNEYCNVSRILANGSAAKTTVRSSVMVNVEMHLSTCIGMKTKVGQEQKEVMGYMKDVEIEKYNICFLVEVTEGQQP